MENAEFGEIMKQEGKFSEIVRRQREIKNISLREFAGMIEISPTYLSRIENGKENAPSAGVVEKIAQSLGLSKEDRYILFAKAGSFPPEVEKYFMENPVDFFKFFRWINDWKAKI